MINRFRLIGGWGYCLDNVYTQIKNNMDKNFKGYPIRQIRLADDLWKELRKKKIKSAKTWNNFIKQLLEK